MAAGLLMFIEVTLGLEADIAWHTRVRSLVSMSSYMFLQHARFGAAPPAVGTDVTTGFEWVLSLPSPARLVGELLLVVWCSSR